jgi:hypothetical protein
MYANVIRLHMSGNIDVDVTDKVQTTNKVQSVIDVSSLLENGARCKPFMNILDIVAMERPFSKC